MISKLKPLSTPCYRILTTSDIFSRVTGSVALSVALLVQVSLHDFSVVLWYGLQNSVVLKKHGRECRRAFDVPCSRTTQFSFFREEVIGAE